MKRHLVSIYYNLPHPFSLVTLTTLVSEVLGDNGKPIVFPRGIFKAAFGRSLPDNTIITIS